MTDHRQDNGYTKVYQDDGSCVHLPLADYADVVRSLNSRPRTQRTEWEGVTLGGGNVWVRLDTVTCVLEVTATMVEEERALEVTNG